MSDAPPGPERPWNDLLIHAEREEYQYYQNAKPSLGYALQDYLRAREAGVLDREGLLRLLFLTWYNLAEPPWPGDGPGALRGDVETSELFSELFDANGGESATDAEFLFIAGVLAAGIPDALDSSRDWRSVGLRCWAAALERLGGAVEPEGFRDRGTMGWYLADVLKEHGRAFLGQRV